MSIPPIAATIDLDAPGKRIGRLELLWSNDIHAYGVIPVPIAVICNGEGPTALITAGIHGDEYEGQVIVRRFIRELRPENIHGRIVLMPAVNLPAVLERRRVSPIDAQNMNRAFPGDPESGPTAMIADCIERRLLPFTQYAVDLHSGGTQSIFAPCGYVYALGDADFRKRKLAAAHAFGAPRTVVVASTSSRGSLSAACERHGVVMIATELGGGALLDRTAIQIGIDGTLALLRHAGVLQGDAADRRTVLFHTAGRAASVTAPIGGMLEHFVEVGAEVEAGDTAGRIWPMDDISREPVELKFAISGTVLARRTMPIVLAGDTACHTGERITDEAFQSIGLGSGA